MRKLSFLLTILFMFACTTNPVTGKKYVNMVGNSQLFPMAFQQYSQVLNKEKLSTNQQQTQMIKTVGHDIKTTVEQILAAKNQSEFLSGYEWDFNLIENDALNAWCMPGGKVAFYTGIMPVCQNKNGVAVVMGHEVTHAIAEHSAQRASQGMIAQGLQLGGNIALSNSKYRNVFNSLYPIGAQAGILAYSRKHELEADREGLKLMAMAGYDPREAPKFWKRMQAKSQANGQKAPPEFFSTHPNPGRRIAQLEAELPNVLPLYQAAKKNKK